MDKTQIIRQVVTIILNHAKPDRIYLYGSQASGEASALSDIDIAYDDHQANHMAIKEDVENLETLIKIDVTNLAYTEQRFQHRVRSMGRVLYSASKKLRSEDGLHNFTQALSRFVDVVDKRDEFDAHGFGDIYVDTAVKRFEFTYEMRWKCLKRYLDFMGITATTPRQVFKEAYSQQLITEEQLWLDMIESRNLSSHIYNEFEMNVIVSKFTDYKQVFIQLQDKIKSLLIEQK